jgi:hypothetical protein
LNAPAATNSSLEMQRPASGRAEHISLEAEPDPAPDLTQPTTKRAVQATYTLITALRRRNTQLTLLEGHFVAVRSSDSHQLSLDYVLDLRFVHPKPVTVRHIAWGWLAAAMLLLGSGTAITWLAPGPWPVFLESVAFGIVLICLLGTIGTLLKFARATTESLQFLSEHGAAVLIDITGSIGSTRQGKRFFVELIKSIRAAKQVRPQPKAQWLRDEMREHHRLRELEVISEADYEASKGRILKAHA